MKLYIPELGDKLELTKDFTFTLYAERRNNTLGFALGLRNNKNTYGIGWKVDEEEPYTSKTRAAGEVTIPKGTVLKVERIYVRNGLKEFDSITFRAMAGPDPKYLKTRFWVKLDETRNLEFKEG